MKTFLEDASINDKLDDRKLLEIILANQIYITRKIDQIDYFLRKKYDISDYREKVANNYEDNIDDMLSHFNQIVNQFNSATAKS